MHIQDLVGQYNNSTQSPQMTGTTGVSKIVSALRDMGPGNIFEGTVNSVKGGQVVLGLSNGQTVTARMDGRVSLTVGESMFFQVKSNEGGTISIKPYTVMGNQMNITLMDALKAAGLPIDGRNLSMVNSMMEEQMSIDAGSLNSMEKVIVSNPNVEVGTLVQMQKLGLPITPEMTSQFQNYMDDKQAITQTMDEFIMELPQSLSSSELSPSVLQSFGQELLAVVTEGLPEEVSAQPQVDAGAFLNLVAGEDEVLAGLINGEAAAVETAEAGQEAQMSPEAQANAEAQTNPDAGTNGEASVSGAVNGATETSSQAIPYTLGAVLDDSHMEALNKQINALLSGEVSEAVEGQEAAAESEQANTMQLSFDKNDSTVSVLRTISDMLSRGSEDAPLNQTKLMNLFSGKEFQALVKDAMEQQWLIKPKDLGSGDKMKGLYDKVESQLSKIEELVKASGQTSDKITNLAQDIRSNISFMNTVNEAYTYVQIPLKMSGQNASGELYVYTNKKQLQQGSDELTAFLHLDMDNLGSTDVSVRMKGRKVDTKFYFDNDASYDLVEAHLPQLQARLAAKGYDATITVNNDGKQVNFVEDFLKKDAPTAGQVHRYSFDVRA